MGGIMGGSVYSVSRFWRDQRGAGVVDVMVALAIMATIVVSLVFVAVGNAQAAGLIDCYKAEGAQEGGDPALAIDYYTRCIAWGGQTRENLAVTHNYRGIAYADQGEYERAIRDHDEAIRLDPSYAHAYYNRGLAHLEEGDQDLAVQDYNQAVGLNPGYADAPYAEVLTTRKPQADPSTTSSPPATQELEIAPAGLSEVNQKSFAIHLASLRTKNGAKVGWKNLQSQFPELLDQKELIVRSIDLEGQGTFFRVMTGPFQDRTGAQDLCAEFKAFEQYCTVKLVQ